MNDEKPWSLEDIRFVVKDEHGRALGKIGEYTVVKFYKYSLAGPDANESDLDEKQLNVRLYNLFNEQRKKKQT